LRYSSREEQMAMTSFDEWALTVDALCREHLACGWHDLCGDLSPLRIAFAADESPTAFVRWWANKYDLQWQDRPRQTGSKAT
jgi:hypothetical protein